MNRPARRQPKPNNFAFIDSQNVNITVQKHGWKIDWKKLRAHLADNYGVAKAYMFIGYVPEFEDMYRQLHDAGYLIVLKPTFDLTRPRPEELEAEQAEMAETGEGGKKLSKKSDKADEDDRKTKGNVDADLVLWAMKELPNYDKAVIVSGDGDYYSLVEYLQGQDKLLKLLPPSGNYSSLYNKFDDYVERLDLARKLLSYRPRRTKRK